MVGVTQAESSPSPDMAKCCVCPARLISVAAAQARVDRQIVRRAVDQVITTLFDMRCAERPENFQADGAVQVLSLTHTSKRPLASARRMT